MAIFSNEQLDAILNEKGVTDRIAENEEKLKAAKDKAVENFKKNTSRKNKKKTKFKLDENGNIIDIDDPEFQSLQESEENGDFVKTINGEKYRVLTKNEKFKMGNKIKKYHTIEIDGKTWIADNIAKYSIDPGRVAGASAGASAGAAIGGALGGVPGSIAGSGIGTYVGSIAGDRIQSNLQHKKYYKEEYDEYEDTESLEEIFINDKKYRPVTKADEKNGIKLKDAIVINGKKYIYDSEAQAKYNRKHPVEYIGKQVGSLAGGTAGAALGGASGAVAGAALGGTVGTIAGASVGATKGGHTTSKAIRAVADVPSKIKKKIKREEFDYRNVYRSPEYSMAMEQYFDITDNETRKILLAVNEEDQNKVLVGLTSKLYENIIDKVDDIDFGEIPMTKGDITKLSNYKTLLECTETMTRLLIEFKQDTKPIDTIRTAIDNIASSVGLWKRAFLGNVELPMVVYNTTVLAIIEATTYMISMCVEYIKVPSSDTFQITIDRSALTKSRDHMVFDNLEKFNSAYRKGQITNAMEYVIKENSKSKNFAGTSIGAGAALVGITALLFCIIPIIRELIFLFYYNRVRVSEYFDVQADMLQMNAYNVENNRLDLNKEEKKRITSKQLKIAERFRKIANKIGVEMKDSEKKAVKEISSENKKYKVEDVVDELPDSAGGALF